MVGSFKERHKYTGHIRDEDTGLEYAKARYLNTKYNRFISQDKQFWATPKEYLQDPQLWNSYAYARDNPFRYIDPNGYTPAELTGGIIGSVVQNVGNTVQGTVNAVFHPVSTVQSIASSVKNLPQTVHNVPQAARNIAQEFKNSSDTNKGAMIGTGAFFIGSIIVPEARLGTLSDSTLVCRGGACTANKFIDGAESMGKDGKLYGVSVTGGNASIEALSQGLPHSKIGIGSLNEINRLGGEFVASPKSWNNFYGKINGLTGEQLESIFGKNIINNPNKLKK